MQEPELTSVIELVKQVAASEFAAKVESDDVARVLCELLFEPLAHRG